MTMQRRALLASTTLALALALGAPTPVEAQDQPHIAFVSFTQDITDMYGQILRGMQRRLDEHGFAYEITTAAPQGADDFAGMDRILADIATIQPDYAVIGGSSFELIEDRIKQIQDTGSTVIVIDVLPDSLDYEPAVDPLTWVAVDHHRMGIVGGTWIAERFCEAGESPVKIALFNGTAASEISQLRMGGAMEAIREVTGACGVEVEVANEVFADFNRERAYNLIQTVSTAHPDLDLVIGANSNTALGIMDGLAATGKLEGGPKILGMGGQLDEMAAICRGDIAAAGFRDAQRMGFVTADSIMAHAEGREGEVEKVTIAELPILYDCDSVFEHVPFAMLDNDGFRNLIDQATWNDYVATQQ